MSLLPILWEDTLASFQGPVSVWGTVRGPTCVPGESTKWSEGQEPEFRGPWVRVGVSQGPDSVKENLLSVPGNPESWV